MDLYTVRKQLNMGMPLTSIKLRVTDYARVSTDTHEQKKSLQNQVEHFEQYIKENPNWTYVKGYVDDGITGTSDIKRDNFMKMIEDARSGKFDLIVTKEVSRFARDLEDSIHYIRELKNAGVGIYFENQNLNTFDSNSELILNIMFNLAQDESRKLSSRVKFGHREAIRKGHVLGSSNIIGYKKDKCNLVIVEEEANVVKRLFSLYAIDNWSITKIAKTFNDENIETCQKKKWCTSTLTRMLKNPKYKGYYCGKKTEIIDYMTKKVKIIPEKDWVLYEDKVRIPPIVEDDLWERANERLKTRSKSFGDDYKEDKIMYQNRYPLSAKMYCAEHNEVFHRRQQCKSSDDITWTCAKYLKEGKKVCDSPNIRESEIYTIFDDIMASLEIELSNVSNILLDLYENNKKNIGIDNKMSELKKQRDRILVKKDKLLELNIDGDITNSEFNSRNNECNKELSTIDENMALLERSKQNYDDIQKKNKKLEKIIKQKIKDTTTKKGLIDLLLDKIVVSKINNDKENMELKIFFNFSKNFLEKEVQQAVIPSMENFKNFMRKDYEFKRGYNTTGTRRYIVKYQVNSYICV